MFKKTLLVLVLFIFCAVTTTWAVPRLIPYQGKLTNSSGVAINGTSNIQFGIYRNLTGGPGIWSETHWNVPITNGLFDVVLGSVNALNLDFSEAQYYLQIAVNGDALIPRQRLISEVFAIRAIYADSAGVPPDVITAGDNVSLLVNDAGYVGSDTLGHYSLIGHSHNFSTISGTATDAQIPNNITILFADSTGAVTWGDIANLPDEIMMEGENVVLLNIDTLGAYSDTFHAHNFNEIGGTATDAQVPDDISIDYADSTGAVHWDDITGVPGDLDDGDDFEDNDWAYNTGSDLTGEIYHSGNVGIMTTDPAYPLHVVGPPGGYAFKSEGNLLINSGLDFGSGLGDSNQVLIADGLGNCDWQDIEGFVPQTLDGLDDVNTTGLIDGQVIKWFSVAGEWRPAMDVGGTTGADNWGTQVVRRDNSLVGDGTPAQPLAIDWNSVKDYINTTIKINDLLDVNDAGVADAQVLTWVDAASQWRPVSIGPGGLGDNWGTQIVQSDLSINGDGTAGDPLAVNWDTLGAYLDTFTTIKDLFDVDYDNIVHGQVLKWDGDDTVWHVAYDLDDDYENELIDFLIWEPTDSLGFRANTLRIIEHAIEQDVVIPVNRDNLADNSINDLADVNTTGAENHQIFRFDGSTWKPISFSYMLSTFDLNTIGDVNDETPDAGDVLEWDGTEWRPGTNIGAIVNNWIDYTGYMSPSTDGVADIKIFDVDSPYVIRVYEDNSTAGVWYGAYIYREGAAASDGYGTYSYAGTSGGVSSGSEFYGVKGEASGGLIVYGIYGDGEVPGTGGVGYGVYGRGKNFGVAGYGTATSSKAIYGLGTNGYAGYFEGGKNYFDGNVGIGTENPSCKLDVKGRIKDQTGYVMPVGAVIPYAGSTAPTGWLMCDGTLYGTATYADLFAVISYTYGGSGTNFRVPNLKGRVVVGLDGSDADFDALNDASGAKTHTLTVNEMPSHNHSCSTEGDHWHYIDSPFDGAAVKAHSTGLTQGFLTSNEDGSDDWYNDNFVDWMKTDTDGDHSHTIGNRGGDSAHNNLQPYRVLNYIIKY
ncbi:tail fiber protein [bacterium]|nr:tail fiber protein [bacterium]